MSEYKIERKIPIPRRSNSVNEHSVKYPFRDMEIGDSIFFAKKGAAKAQNAAAAWGRKNNRTFTSRTVEGGVRIWRTA